MPLEVRMQAGAEGLVPESGDQLLDVGSTLLIGDGVEVDDRFVGVLDASVDGMRGNQLVLAIG